MKIMQRATAFVGWAILLGIAALMILESSRVISDHWRVLISDTARWLAQPPIQPWVAAIVGAIIALLAVLAFAVQLLPVRRKVRGVTIDSTDSGSTEVTAPALYRRLGYELSLLPDVVDAVPIPDRKRVRFRITLIDSGDLEAVERASRAALSRDTWASLGMEPRPVDLLLTYGRNAKPVTRKEQLV